MFKNLSRLLKRTHCHLTFHAEKYPSLSATAVGLEAPTAIIAPYNKQTNNSIRPNLIRIQQNHTIL